MRVAVYARVSTIDQEPENQLQELRRYVEARGWTFAEYVDHGVSGAKERRPALDRLMRDARRRKFDAVVVWRLDRLGRNLRHLILLLEELSTVGISFVSLSEGIDATTAAGKLQLHLLGAFAEFERGRIQERVMAGLARARARGVRLGRPEASIPQQAVVETAVMPLDDAAKALGVSRSTVKRWRKRVQQSLPPPIALSPNSPPV